jgi:nitroimidazol reductase NimA-like FMN-containing flavoprotein (pyridoxamine 5'-phosphate oxidase superfamily)
MHPSIQMSDDERDEFLERHKTLRVATLSPDGFPHNVPVGYQWIDGQVFFPSDEESQKIANLRRDERVCCIVDEGSAGDDYDVLTGVMIQGHASVYDETGHDEVTHDDLMERLFEGGEVADQERYERVDRVVVEVDPVNIVTWDFSKVN